MTTTSSDRTRGRFDSERWMGNSRSVVLVLLLLFKFFLRHFFSSQVELIQQAMKITAANAQFYGGPQPVSRMNAQRRRTSSFLNLEPPRERTRPRIVASDSQLSQFVGQIGDPEILVTVGNTTLRSITFCSSRTFPGQEYREQRAQKSGSKHASGLAMSLGKDAQEVFRQIRDVCPFSHSETASVS